jgi:hypothetical protein
MPSTHSTGQSWQIKVGNPQLSLEKASRTLTRFYKIVSRAHLFFYEQGEVATLYFLYLCSLTECRRG